MKLVPRRLTTTVLWLVMSVAVLITCGVRTAEACSFCLPGDAPLGGVGPNVYWRMVDSVAACPAGDSLAIGDTQNHHPSKLRIEVWYDDVNCNPKFGVPPESLTVTWSTASGNASINDEGAQVYADDSTDACGHTRFTIPSLSGCGSISLTLHVSGRSEGSKVAVIRTVDVGASGRVDNSDLFQTTCDVNYDGSTGDDGVLAAQHLLHWHRNALHGTLVRRTNYCETCQDGSANTRGESQLSWSPGQRWIAYTAFVDESPNPPSCKVFIVPSDPHDGNIETQLTSAPVWYHDYDPQWSPLNDVIVFDRGDSVIIKRMVPWAGGTETTVTASSNCGCNFLHGDDIPSVSPDGQWVAFSRCNQQPPCGPGGWSLWKVPITGGAATQLTPQAARADFYSSWSPDGQTIFFQRIDSTIGPQWTLWSVPAAGGTATQVFIPPASGSDIFDAVQPAASPDGQVLVMGYGKRDALNRNVMTNTLDPTIVSPTATNVVANYTDTTFAELGDFPILTPRLSPDGTRLALGSKQIWAARRNMNLPPRITQVGSQGVVDTTAVVNINAARGLQTSVQLVASDPEGDPLTFNAYFLQDGMTFDTGSGTLTWTPTLPVGTTVYVKFVASTETWPSASGGTDAIIGALTVTSTAQPRAGAAFASGERVVPIGPNPTREAFAIATPALHGTEARLLITDVSGRLVAVVSGVSGTVLVWDGRGRDGRAAQPGVYPYRLMVEGSRTEGKIVVAR